MKCIFCGGLDSKVVDSRLSEDGSTIRRRRECTTCSKRYTTYEKIEYAPILVVKNNGDRQSFDPMKIKAGIMKACEKRPVSIVEIEKIIAEIEREITNSLSQEITSKKIGELAMGYLKQIDDVSYVRFASVHREFKDIKTFLDEIQSIINNK